MKDRSEDTMKKASNLVETGRSDRITHKLLLTATAVFVLFCTTVSVLAQTGFEGSLNSVTITDTVGSNSTPTAIFTYTQNGDTFTFDASGSSDSDGNITEYSWDFGDGGTGINAIVTHQYSGDTRPVTLTVIDDQGGIALIQHLISETIEPLIPEADDVVNWTTTPNDGSSHYSKLVDNDDNTYNYIDTDWHYDRYIFKNTTKSTGKSINKVSMLIRAKYPSTDILYSYLDIRYQKYAASLGFGTGQWHEYKMEYPINPATNSAWTSSDIDNLKAGYHRKNGTVGARYFVSKIQINVEYQAN